MRSSDDLSDVHLSRKLHLGCGRHVLTGWINTDRRPIDQSVHYLDVTEPFEFGDETFDLIFTEHLIEHLSFSQGQAMLAECSRVLRRGGVIRVTTPNLRFLIDLYGPELSELQERYIAWATSTFIPTTPCNSAAFVINNFMRDWGHQFIYDTNTLRLALELAGFCEIQECAISESMHPQLMNLENVRRMPPGFLALESLIVEAVKRS